MRKMYKHLNIEHHILYLKDCVFLIFA